MAILSTLSITTFLMHKGQPAVGLTIHMAMAMVTAGNLTIDASSFTNTGLITIQGSAAVSEPDSLGLCAFGDAVMGWQMRQQ